MSIHHEFPFLYFIAFIAVLSVVEPVWKNLAARTRRKPHSRRFSRIRSFRVGTDLLK